MAEQKSIEYLCVKIGDTNVAIPTEFVEEVFETKLITCLPCSPDFILGMVNVRGGVIPVLDLWQVAGDSETINKIIILNSSEGLVGLLISELVDLIRFETVEGSGGKEECLKQWGRYFPTLGLAEETYFIMQVNELISFTITNYTGQAVP